MVRVYNYFFILHVFIYYIYIFFKEHTFFIMDGKIEPLILKEISQL